MRNSKKPAPKKAPAQWVVVLLAGGLWAMALGALVPPQPAHAETVVVAGSMSTQANVADHITLDIPAGLTTLTLQLPLPQAASDFGYDQNPGDTRVESSRPPDHDTQQVDSFGNRYRILTFEHPPAGQLEVTIYEADAQIRADLTQPAPDAPFPVTDYPSDAAQYLQPSKNVQSDDTSIHRLAQEITEGSPDEATAASRITAWVRQNMNYAIAVQGVMPSDALWAIGHREGSCDGWAHVFLALARAAGIPARFAAGYSLGGSLQYPADTDGDATVTTRGETQTHAWAELWFPKIGWVPYEPQGSAAFADSHHLRAWVGMDASSVKPFLRWCGYQHSLPEVDYQETLDVTKLSDNPNLSFVGSDNLPEGTLLLARRQVAQE